MVDNLLLSLDHMSSLQFAGVRDDEDAEFDTEKYRLPSMLQFPQLQSVQPANRIRTHTYSSSLSSGYDNYGVVVADSPSSKYSSPAKGRRSNSSSNFPISHSLQGKLNNARRKNSASRSSSDTQGYMGNSYAMNGSSDLENVDHGYGSIVETSRQPWAGRRSVSMDHIYNEAAAQEGLSMLSRGRPVPSVYSKYDSHNEAAPEPGIPAGPRKKLNPTATGPVYVNAVPPKPSIRKVNTQSDLRTASRPGTVPQYIHDQASEFVRANSIRGVPPVPAPHQTATRSTSGHKPSRKDAPSPQRERPGFFKRVFGGGSRTTYGADSHDSNGYLDKSAAPARTKSQTSHDTKTQSRQASRDHTAMANQSTPSLSKKPSSFFRRRKKSISDTLRPPPLPLNAANNINLAVRTVELSPSVSSLRKVMDPYLNKDAPGEATVGKTVNDDIPRPATGESTTDSDDLVIFHSGYTPPPDASLGMRDPLRRDVSARGKASHERSDSSRLKVKVKKRKESVQPIVVPSHTSLHARDVSVQREGLRKLTRTTTNLPSTSPIEKPSVSPLSDALSDHPDNKENERPVSRASTGDRILASQGGSLVEPNGESRNFSDTTAVSCDLQDDSRVFAHQCSGEFPLKQNICTLEPLVPQPVDAREEQADKLENSPADDTDDASRSASVAVPIVVQSPVIPSVYHSATSLPLPSVQVDGKDISRKSVEDPHPEMPSAMVDDGAEYRERARKIFEGDEEDVTKAEAASWLGERNTLSTRTLQAYMQLFDLTGLNILSALRALCNKLLLRGETQQFDRIITALSERWCDCNPNHGFKAQDVVHTIFYSIILLNTDLHLADIGGKMSKNAYVKNTLPTIRRVVTDAAPNAFDETIKPSPVASRPSIPWTDSGLSAGVTTAGQTSDAPSERTSLDGQKPHMAKRLSIRPPVFRSESDGWISDYANSSVSNSLVNQPWNGPMRGWELEIENILKSFFNSIRSDPLPLLDSPGIDTSGSERNLTVSNVGGLKRSGSVVSKAPSDTTSFRSKPGLRTMTMGWQSRVNRSRPKLYPASTLGSSRTSFDDSNSVWSPAPSSMWSKNSFAKTLTSPSMNSLGYHLSPTTPDFKHSIGFANALSQAIIREEGTTSGNGDADSISVPGGLLEDEALALEGAPWAKEGLVKHKHHLDAPDRKAKERNWNDCFAVLGKGKLTLFAFNTSTRSQSMGRKAMQKHHPSGRAASLQAPKVGGGDWMENAEQLEVFVLRQTIASVLPPPGYSKTRPHVWALSLPSGAVHLFQVGTPEIANEFMSTANYWSARLSKEPLSGGVSNIEYGWSDQVVNPVLLERSESFNSPPPSIQNVSVTRHIHTSSGGGQAGRPSFQSSLRGSLDTGFGSVKARLPGDKIQIAEWHPPTQSMMASQLLEVDQFKAVSSYVSSVEAELGKHNELKHAIELAYSPRHANYNRAMTNWQRKSDYLLREIVKFRTYMDSLAAAQKAKDQFYARKAEQDILKANVNPVSSENPKEERDDLAHPPTPAG